MPAETRSRRRQRSPDHTAKETCSHNTCPGRSANVYWIQCGPCKQWYHGRCVGVPFAIAKRQGYACQDCIQWSNGISNPSSTGLTQHLQDLSISETNQSSGLSQAMSNLSIDACDPLPEPTVHIGLGNLRSLLKCRNKVLKFVPKASRISFCILLESLFRDVVASPLVEEPWLRLLAAPSLCLRTPSRGGKNRTSLSSVVNKQILSFQQASDFRNLIQAPPKSKPLKRKPKTDPEKLADAVSEKLSDLDLRGAIRLVSSEETIAENSPETIQLLQAKHPAVLKTVGSFLPRRTPTRPRSPQVRSGPPSTTSLLALPEA